MKCVLARKIAYGMEQHQSACVSLLLVNTSLDIVHCIYVFVAIFVVVIDCDTLNDPENGQITFTPGVVATIQTGLDAVANYTCNVGI